MPSIEAQTYKNIETTIIKDERWNGLNWAKNKGMKNAKGKYTMFCDDDIILEKTCIEKMVNALEGTNFSVAFCDFKQEGAIKGVHRAGAWDYERLKKGNYISGIALIRTKDIPVLPEGIKRLVDWDLWLTFCENNKGGVYIPEILFTAFYQEDGISLGNDYQKWHNIVCKRHQQ